MKMTIHDFEEEARAWCVQKGLNPDDRVSFPDPNGYAVARYRLRWVEYAIRLHDNWMMSGFVSRAIRRLGL
jgi:hypothetical protein